MGLIDSIQIFTAGASGIVESTAQAAFKRGMDVVLFDLGRDVTIHLPESKSQCVDPDCTFDSFYKRYIGTNGQVCQTCRGQGFYVEPRYTIYRANIRWANEPFNKSKDIKEDQSIGRIGVNFVRTKMLESAIDNVRDSIGATVDDISVELFQPPRKIGFGSVLYTVAWWKVVNR